MFKRPLIRSLLLSLLLLTATGWALSRCYGACLSYHHNNLGLGFSTHSGAFSLGMIHDEFLPDGWDYDIIRGSSGRLWPSYGDDDDLQHFILGFCFWHYSYPSDPANIYQLFIPYYFPTLLLSLATLYIFRKTRPTLSPATAFPVETARSKP